MRSATFVVGLSVLLLTAVAANAQVIFTTDYTTFVANSQPLDDARWDTTVPFGTPITGSEFTASDGLVFSHLSGTGLHLQDECGSQVIHTDTTADASGMDFMYGLGTDAPKPATNYIRINRDGTGAPGFTALGVWLIDAEIYRKPSMQDNRLELTTNVGGNPPSTTTSYDVSGILPPWVSGGTLTNVMFFGFYVPDPKNDLTRITQLDVLVGNSVEGNEQSSIGQVDYSDKVPEPATMGLLGLGALGLLRSRRRRRK